MTFPPNSALIVIDVQNDYSDEGQYPQWQAEETRQKIETLMQQAQQRDLPIILVQHRADNSRQPAPFFNPDTVGVEIHPSIIERAPEAPIVIKQHADSFLNTTLEQELAKLDTQALLICGMMTHNCVTHTAISASAAKYQVRFVSDCCTSVDPMVHAIALNALSDRVELIESDQLFPAVQSGAN
ncbi:cysteine hydrolase family protein [Motiliproteus sp.]|uniref:cysteine hydrolase family protein n=1 Tax=Motiliproteus sp. TaxID=1898955 RepID=UPI003BA87DF0